MTPFKAKREDGRALWEVVFDEIKDDPYETIYTYEKIGDLIGSSDRHEIYGVMGHCKRQLWKRAQKSIRNLHGVGYRMLKPQEHEGQALDYQEQGRRKVKNAVRVMKATNLSVLNDHERTHVLAVQSVLVAMGRAIDHHSARLNRHEDILRDLEERVSNMEHGRDHRDG